MAHAGRYAHVMVPVRSVLVDFDGTACASDVSEVLLQTFGDPGWDRYDDLVVRGEMGLRDAARAQAGMLRASPEEMVAYAVGHCALDPSFPSFVRWTESLGIPLTIASDGFGFYVQPILRAAGLGHVNVLTNQLVREDGTLGLAHPHGHPDCIGCGTCKMLAALGLRRAHGTVAFVGEGQSDRFGALYSDIVFAKEALPAICERDGVSFFPWESFDDVRAILESLKTAQTRVPPDVCPGWKPAR
jgi:2-hydroxy-3-keto-5-methylthiopentenyl-1-phosphate phosphatase